MSTEPPAASPPAAEPARSTASVRAGQPEASGFSLEFLHDRRDTRVDPRCSLRWDMDDVQRLPQTTTRLLQDPIGALQRTGADLTRGANIGVYGLRIRPSRIIWLERAAPEEAGGLGAAGEDPGRRRLRLSLTPVIEDIRRDLAGAIHRQLLVEGFDAAMPAYRGASYEQKKAITDDALRAVEDLGIKTPEFPELPLVE
ncbi:MAG: hypothetical protein ABII00_12695 [Elusimicrobiota bacterium]